jgi:arginine decarboxylase
MAKPWTRARRHCWTPWPTNAAGRIAAEQITPYPPGIPAVVPGELLDAAVIDYLKAGMVLPDPADPHLEHIRVVASS